MPKSAELFIDGYIGQDMGDGIFGGPKTFGLFQLNEFLSALDKDVNHLNIHINSGGGSVDEGFAIHDKLLASPYSITTIGEGMVGSIATIIFLSGDTRKMFKNSKFFIHNPYIPFTDGLEAKDAQKIADELKAEEERILNFYAEKTGKKSDEIKPFMDKQTSFSSSEAVDMGFVTEIIEKETLNKKNYKLVAYTKNSHLKNNDTMKKEEIVAWFKKLENKLTSLAPAAAVVAQTTKTSEGVDIWYDGDLVVGTKIFIDESMSKPAPDGVHTVGDLECTVKDGAIESIKEVVAAAPDAETAALKTEITTLKADITTKDARIVELELAETDRKKKVSELEIEIVNFKKVLIGEDPATPAGQRTPKAPLVTNRFDKIRNNVVNRYGRK